MLSEMPNTERLHYVTPFIQSIYTVIIIKSKRGMSTEAEEEGK